MAAQKSYAEVWLKVPVRQKRQDVGSSCSLTAEGFVQLAQEPDIPADAKESLELLSQIQELVINAQLKQDWEQSAPAAKKQVH